MAKILFLLRHAKSSWDDPTSPITIARWPLGDDGSALASQTQKVTVAFPGVRLKCPKGAKPKGCKFKLQAVSKKKKGKAESAVAKAKVKAGHSAVVSLKPKNKFRSKLALAKKILVKETVTIDGSRRTRVSKLKVVQ